MNSASSLIVLVALLFIAPVAVAQAPCAESDTVCWSKKARQYTNEYRARNGQGALADGVQAQLTNALSHSRWMLSNAFEHQDLSAATSAVGCGRFINAENLAGHTQRGIDHARQCVDQWIKSPGHRRNLINGDSIEVSIGIVFGPRWVYCTQTFAFYSQGGPAAATGTCAAIGGGGGGGDGGAPASSPTPTPTPTPTPSPSPKAAATSQPAARPPWADVLKGWYSCYCLHFDTGCYARLQSLTGDQCSAGVAKSAQPASCRSACCLTYNYLAPKGQQFPSTAAQVCA